MVKFFLKFAKHLALVFLVVFICFHVFVASVLLFWKYQAVNTSAFMLAHQMVENSSVKQTWVPYDQISTNLKKAVIASEDSGFIKHNGFELAAMKKAIEKNKKGKVRRGGSTISQQLAKNLFLTAHRSYLRKAEEAIITLMIETLWDKKRILTVYLNVVEFGNGIYGVEEAANHYFKKPAKRLTKNQAALLASLLPNPKYYQKNLKNKLLQKKKRIIAKRLIVSKLP